MSVRTCCFACLSLLLTQARLPAQSEPDIVQQIAALMAQGPSGKAHQRYAHAKGIVCLGTFQASPEAAGISRAAHFGDAAVSVIVRFSDGAPDAHVTDSSQMPLLAEWRSDSELDGALTSWLLHTTASSSEVGRSFSSYSGRSLRQTLRSRIPGPLKPFSAAIRFVGNMDKVPVSFATESFYSNNALIFVNSRGERQAGRYRILPMNGSQYLGDAVANTIAPDFLREELTERLAQAPIRFRLVLQLADPDDQTRDGSLVWPDTWRRVELGIVTITSVVPDSVAAERKLAFDPTRLVDGIELSDDPLPLLRSRVCAYSVAGRFNTR